jgi:hypothetical protein
LNRLKQLDLFVERARELSQKKLLETWNGSSFTVEFHRDKGLRVETVEPDAEQLEAFLLTFRQFVAKGEPVFFQSVCNAARLCLTDDELRAHVDDAREQWKQALARGGLKITFDDREWTPEYVLDLWINGVYFHNDEEKRRTLDGLIPEARTLARYAFLDLIVEGVRHIFYVAHLIQYARNNSLLSCPPG